MKHSPGVEIIYACDQCSKAFRCNKSLKAHVKNIHNINGGCAKDNFEFHQTIDTENGKYLFNEHSTETKCVTCGKKGYYDCSNHNCEEGNDGVLDKVKKTSRKQ